MTFFKDLLADLIDKRLWPVAAGLLVALVAVPLVLSRPAPTDAQARAEQQAAAAKAAQVAAAAQPVVSLGPARDGRTRRMRGLSARDPFKAPKPKVTVSTAPDQPKPQPAQTDAGSKGGNGTDGGAKPAPSPTPGGDAPATRVAPKKLATTYKVDLRFGEAGAQRVRRDVPRLTALPSSSDPIVVFLGVLGDGKTAVFLVTSDATAQGDGRCKPSRSDCTYVYLRKGQEEYFDVAVGTAGLAQYVLKVLDIDKVATSAQRAARSRYRRESKAGRTILRAEVGAHGALRYSAASGTLSAVR